MSKDEFWGFRLCMLKYPANFDPKGQDMPKVFPKWTYDVEKCSDSNGLVNAKILTSTAVPQYSYYGL